MYKAAFSIVEAVDWFRGESGRDTLKVLSGMRGAGKSTVIDMYRSDLVCRGVPPERIIRLDFENVRFRHMTSGRDVLASLPPPSKERTYLILDEIVRLQDFERLMSSLYARTDLDVLLTVSCRRLMTDAVRGYFRDRISECRLFPGPGLRRTEDKLDAIWSKIMLFDVLGGHVLADATAIGRLCGYLSDHLCEPVTKRKVASDFRIGSEKLSANTVAAYMELIDSAYIVEFVPVYDVFTGEICKNEGRRVFCIDPVLRAYRFGPSPVDEETRSAYNAQYLELRRKYGRVRCLAAGAAEVLAKPFRIPEIDAALAKAGVCTERTVSGI